MRMAQWPAPCCRPTGNARYRASGVVQHHRRARRRHHQHAATVADLHGLVVEVHADHRIATEALGVFHHLAHRGVLGITQHLLVRARAPTHDVADAGEEVAEDVGAEDRLAGDHAEIAADLVAIEGRGGGHEHGRFLRARDSPNTIMRQAALDARLRFDLRR